MTRWADQVLDGLDELGGSATTGALQRLLHTSAVVVALALQELVARGLVSQVPGRPGRWRLVQME